MNDLHVTLAGRPFDHMVYHLVLTYSNWETATICFSESFESLSQGLSFTHISLLTEVLTVINLAAIFHKTVHFFKLSTEPNEHTITV